MNNVFKVLQNIVDMLTALFDFFIGLIEDIVYIATLLPKVVVNVTQVIDTFIPVEIVALLSTLIALTVLYRVLGRD